MLIPNTDAAIAGQRAQELGQMSTDYISQLLLGGAGAGLALRGGQGLYTTLRKNLGYGKKPVETPVVVVPANKEKEAEAVTAPPAAPSWWNGGSAQSVFGMPQFIPKAVGAMALGGYGGWKLMDWMLDNQRKQELKGELDTSRQRFEQAMQPTNAPGSSLSHDLDALYSRHGRNGKAASLGNTTGWAAGLGLTAETAAALLAGAKTYDWLRGRHDQQLLNAALEDRRRQQVGTQPMYAVPEEFLSDPEGPRTKTPANIGSMPSLPALSAA